MSSDSIQRTTASTENVSYGELEAESNNVDSLEVVSSGADTKCELETAAEILTRLQLDITRSSEKLIDLDILITHMASKESDFQDFSLKDDHMQEDPIVKALEFDLLRGFLDSEVDELESFLSALHSEIVCSQEFVSSLTHLGNTFYNIEDKLHDYENSLKQSFKLVSDIKMQSANFKRILEASSGDENWKDRKDVGGLETNNGPDLSAKIKMQTVEQQRSMLRMLEKSLAREFDLEKKLIESRGNEEELKLRLQEEALCMEQEAEDVWERLFEAENSAEILFGVSKELLQREVESRSKLEDFSEQNKKLIEKASEAENRAGVVESDCKKLSESNMELNEIVSRLQINSIDATNQVEQLGRQLKDSEIKRLHAVASAEASQEKQIMLNCTIRDMDNLIKDLKSKSLRAESLADSTEEKCIMLSESNAELIEEINFLRHKLECFETSLQHADESKKETAKDIRVQTKLITDLVLQLALERERLHKQISSLTKEKKVAIKVLQQVKNPSVTTIGSLDAKVEEGKLYTRDSKKSHPKKESNEEITEPSSTTFEMSTANRDLSETGIDTRHDDPSSELDSVRNIDARQLKFNYVLLVVLIVAIPALAASMFSAVSY